MKMIEGSAWKRGSDQNERWRGPGQRGGVLFNANTFPGHCLLLSGSVVIAPGAVELCPHLLVFIFPVCSFSQKAQNRVNPPNLTPNPSLLFILSIEAKKNNVFFCSIDFPKEWNYEIWAKEWKIGALSLFLSSLNLEVSRLF